jgi:hypothetical protein
VDSSNVRIFNFQQAIFNFNFHWHHYFVLLISSEFSFFSYAAYKGHVAVIVKRFSCRPGTSCIPSVSVLMTCNP